MGTSKRVRDARAIFEPAGTEPAPPSGPNDQEAQVPEPTVPAETSGHAGGARGRAEAVSRYGPADPDESIEASLTALVSDELDRRFGDRWRDRPTTKDAS